MPRLIFRVLRSRPDVVFPDHERCLADMTAFLAGGSDDDEPVRRVCLRRRFAARREGIVQADVIAAAVVAAHNSALRSWLRSDGRDEGRRRGRPRADVRSAFGGVPVPPVAEQPEDVVVVVTRRGAPL